MLQYAAENPNNIIDPSCFISLLDQGASTLSSDRLWNTALHYAIGTYNPKGPTQLDMIARELVWAAIKAAGTHALSAHDAQGRTPLHIAALRGNPRLANLLLHNGADVNAQDNDGNTPMHLIQDSQRMPNLLLTYGADWSIENHAGENPVYSNNCWIAWLNRKVAQ